MANENTYEERLQEYLQEKANEHVQKNPGITGEKLCELKLRT